MSKKFTRFLATIAALLIFTGCEADPGAGSSPAPATDTSQIATTESNESNQADQNSDTGSADTQDGEAASEDQQKQENSKTPGVEAKVTKVVDGDTLNVIYKGEETTVRVLLIDTPETHHPSLGVQPYGKEASEYARQLMDGKTVHLEVAKDGGRDKYGRLLAYVYVGGKSLEEWQLAKGLARVAYVIPPNTKYVDQYRAVEAQAKKQKLGIWSVDGYAQEDGYHPEVMNNAGSSADSSSAGASSSADHGNSGSFEPDASGNCDGAIKGNISDNGKIYHMPSNAFYDRTKAEICFSSRADASEAGFRAAKR